MEGEVDEKEREKVKLMNAKHIAIWERVYREMNRGRMKRKLEWQGKGK